MELQWYVYLPHSNELLQSFMIEMSSLWQCVPCDVRALADEETTYG